MQIIVDFSRPQAEGRVFILTRNVLLGLATALAVLLAGAILAAAHFLAAYWVNSGAEIVSDIARQEIRAQSEDRRRLWRESIGILEDDIAAINARVLALHRKGAILSDYVGLQGEEMFALPQNGSDGAPTMALLCEANLPPAPGTQLPPPPPTPDPTASQDRPLENRQIQISDILHHQTAQLEELERKYATLRDHGIDVTVLKNTVPKERPIMGRHWVSSRYGYRRDPFTGRRAFHGGDDYAANRGTPIVAGAAGIVLYAGKLGNYGNAVHLYHGDGISTLYGHMHKINVQIWQYVSQNERIGTVGSTGRSTGPHLHYEIRIDGRPKSILKTIRELRQERNIVA